MVSRRSFMSCVGALTAACLAPKAFFKRTPRCQSFNTHGRLSGRADVERLMAEATPEQRDEGLMLALATLHAHPEARRVMAMRPLTPEEAWTQHYMQKYVAYGPLSIVGVPELKFEMGPGVRYWQDIYQGHDPKTGQGVIIAGIVWLELYEDGRATQVFCLHREHDRYQATRAIQGILPQLQNKQLAEQLLSSIGGFRNRCGADPLYLV
jgi:hypothetical protein